jgi:hypothetical protein
MTYEITPNMTYEITILYIAKITFFISKERNLHPTQKTLQIWRQKGGNPIIFLAQYW